MSHALFCFVAIMGVRFVTSWPIEHIDLCLNSTGTVASNTPGYVAERWEMFQNCNTEPSAVIFHLEKMYFFRSEILSTDLEISALLSSYNINTFKAGTCIVIQSSNSTCEKVPEMIKDCTDVIWAFKEAPLPLSISYRKQPTRMLKSFSINYSYSECASTASGSNEKQENDIAPDCMVAAIILGVLLVIVTILACLLVLRLYRRDIQMLLKRQSDRNNSITLNNEDGIYTIPDAPTDQFGQNPKVAKKKVVYEEIQPAANAERQTVVNQIYEST